MKETVNVIIIHWEKIPFSRENILNLNKSHDHGIYSIYGDHYAYGKESLLYIGKAQDRTFAIRMTDGDRDYYDFEESTAQPKYIRLGFITKGYHQDENERYNVAEYEANWKNNIAIAEQILISTHSPAFNKDLRNRLSQVKYPEDYLIINKGDYGSLLPELSTIRNSYKYYNFIDTYLGAEQKT